MRRFDWHRPTECLLAAAILAGCGGGADAARNADAAHDADAARNADAAHNADAAVRARIAASASPGGRILTMPRDRLYGVFYPARHPRGPAVITIGGSEGRLRTTPVAKALSLHGYPALALAYFNDP